MTETRPVPPSEMAGPVGRRHGPALRGARPRPAHFVDVTTGDRARLRPRRPRSSAPALGPRAEVVPLDPTPLAGALGLRGGRRGRGQRSDEPHAAVGERRAARGTPGPARGRPARHSRERGAPSSSRMRGRRWAWSRCSSTARMRWRCAAAGAGAAESAYAAARRGSWDDAVRLYADAVRAEPDRAAYFSCLARAEWRAARWRHLDVESLDDGGPPLVEWR